jgi:hypothetical protein
MICHREYQLDSERGSWRIVGSGLASVTSTNDAKGGWGIALSDTFILHIALQNSLTGFSKFVASV